MPVNHCRIIGALIGHADQATRFFSPPLLHNAVYLSVSEAQNIARHANRSLIGKGSREAFSILCAIENAAIPEQREKVEQS